MLARYGKQIHQLVETAAAGGVTDAAQLDSIRALSSAIASTGILSINAPWWMIHPIVLVGLTALTFIRLQATRDQEFERMSTSANHLISPLCDGVITFGLVDAQSTDIMRFFVSTPHPIGEPALGMVWIVSAAGPSALPLMVAVAAACGTGAVTWLQVLVRNSLVGALMAIDVGGHLGLVKLYRMAETGTVTLGLVLVVVLPLVALLLGLLTLGALLDLRATSRTASVRCARPARRAPRRCIAARWHVLRAAALIPRR